MKTLHLHVGTPKTATSSIQVACEKNNDLLHEYGYSFPLFPYRYPGVRRQRNGHFLIEASNMKNEIPDADNSWEDRLALGLEMIHGEFEKYENVILTDESFWRSVNYNIQSFLTILQKDAADHGYRIHLIVYLRRQDSFLISRWNQFVKEGWMTELLPRHLNRILTREPLVADYASALDKLAARLGKENITVRRFDPSTWVGGSIYADFADAIGLPSCISLKAPPKDENPGLKGNAVKIQLMINKSSSLRPEDKVSFNKYTKKLSKTLPEEDQYNIFSTEETVDFLAQFREGNNRVAREYIGDGKPMFSAKIKEQQKWERNNPYFSDDVMAFYDSLPDDKKALYLAAMLSDLDTCYEEMAQMSKSYKEINKDYNKLIKNLAQYRHIEKYARFLIRIKNIVQKFFRKLRKKPVQ